MFQLGHKPTTNVYLHFYDTDDCMDPCYTYTNGMEKSGVVDMVVRVDVGVEYGAGAGRGEAGGIDTADFEVHGEAAAVAHAVHRIPAARHVLDGQRTERLFFEDDPHRLCL